VPSSSSWARPDLQEATVDGGDGHPDRRLLEGGAEARLGVGLGALGLGLGVDVADGGVDLRQLAAVSHGDEVGLGPAPRSVGAAQAHGERGVLLARQQTAHGGDGGGGVAGVDEVDAARADQRARGEVEQLEAALGDLADRAVGREGGQHVAGVVGELARAGVGGAAGGLGAVARRQGVALAAQAAPGVDAEPDEREPRQHQPRRQRQRRSDDGPERPGQRREDAQKGSATAVARGHPPLFGQIGLRLKCRAARRRPARARWCTG
jgi:hypothetical protein